MTDKIVYILSPTEWNNDISKINDIIYESNDILKIQNSKEQVVGEWNSRSQV